MLLLSAAGGGWDGGRGLACWAVGDLWSTAGDGGHLGVVDSLGERDSGNGANEGGDQRVTHLDSNDLVLKESTCECS